MATEDEIIKWYSEAEDKTQAIKLIAKKSRISQEGLIKFLEQHGLETPKDLKITEEWEEGYEEEQVEEEMFSAIAVQRYWEEVWKGKEELEKAMWIHNYILEKFNINDFGIYRTIQDYIVKTHGTKGLMEYIDKVMKGVEKKQKPEAEQILENVRTRWLTKLMNELSDEGDQDKPLASQFYRIYKKFEPLITKAIGKNK